MPYVTNPIPSGLYRGWEQKTFNLTPHAISIRIPSGGLHTIEPEGEQLRADMKVWHLVDNGQSPIVISGSIPTIGATYRAATLAAEIASQVLPGDVLLVSTLAADALAADAFKAVPRGAQVAVPDSGPTAERDASGRIIAVTRLILRLYCEPTSLVRWIDCSEPVIMVDATTGLTVD